LVDVLGAVASVTVVVFGVVRVAAGAITPGDLIVFATYATRTYKPLRELARQSTAVAAALARAERVREVLEADELLEERAGATAPARVDGEVVLEGVSFAYSEGRPALRDVSLRIPAAARIAIVGASGAGKSTLGALLARFYDPSAGRVLLDGTDVRDLPVDFLRGRVGFLLQDTILFAGSVAENIAYANEASPEQIAEAAHAAGADAFVRALPDGYDTRLGPRGVGLSGGQRQRIGIARVLLRDPSVLVLDEPTVGLDAATESTLIESLERLMVGRTSVMVTHSIALAARCGHVVVMDRGQIVEQGPPAELVECSGYFSRLAAHQGIAVSSAGPLLELAT
jgi:ABC-type multidrug transport system fused ATPase/permease subunit